MANRRSHGARCGHVKRQLLDKKPLTGELLDFALSVAGAENYVIDAKGNYVAHDGRTLNKNDEPIISMIRKLKAGQPLGEYELHLMIDVFLLHERLAG